MPFHKLIRSRTASEGKLLTTGTAIDPRKEILYLSWWKTTCQLEAWQLSRKKFTHLFPKVCRVKTSKRFSKDVHAQRPLESGTVWHFDPYEGGGGVALSISL